MLVVNEKNDTTDRLDDLDEYLKLTDEEIANDIASAEEDFKKNGYKTFEEYMNSLIKYD